ncbi:hypothetical protein WJX77_001512 [Trebouxia sp. C0004]
MPGLVDGLARIMIKHLDHVLENAKFCGFAMSSPESLMVSEQMPLRAIAVCDNSTAVVSEVMEAYMGSENVCKLGHIINRSAAKNQKDNINKALKSGPEPVQSALDMTVSSDEEQ